MKTRMKFRPALNDILEDRIVLSTTHAAVAHGSAAAVTASQIDLAHFNTQLDQVFATYATDYLSKESAYLKDPNASVTDLRSYAVSRTTQLTQDLSKIITASPSVPNGLIPYVNSALLGSGSDTLSSRLSAVTAVGQNNQTPAQFTADSQKSVDLAYKVTSQTLNMFAVSSNADQFAKTHPYAHLKLSKAQVTNIKAQQGMQTKIQDAFSKFLTAYADARGNTLFNTTPKAGTGGGLIGGPSGKIGTDGGTTGINGSTPGTGGLTGGITPAAPFDFSTNRAAFDTSVQTALNNLNTSLTSAFANNKNASRSFLPALQTAFLGSSSPDANGNINSGLTGSFNGFSTPASTIGLQANAFNNNAFSSINSAFQSTVNRSNALVNSPNFNFTPFPSFSSDPFGFTLNGSNSGGNSTGGRTGGTTTGGFNGGTTTGGFGGGTTGGGFNGGTTTGGFGGGTTGGGFNGGTTTGGFGGSTTGGGFNGGTTTGGFGGSTTGGGFNGGTTTGGLSNGPTNNGGFTTNLINGGFNGFGNQFGGFTTNGFTNFFRFNTDGGFGSINGGTSGGFTGGSGVGGGFTGGSGVGGGFTGGSGVGGGFTGGSGVGGGFTGGSNIGGSTPGGF